jgi:hypothetical protein
VGASAGDPEGRCAVQARGAWIGLASGARWVMALEHEELQDLGIGTWCLALALGILCRAFLSKYIPVPYTVILLIAGLIIGCIIITCFPNSEDIFTQSIATWVHM